MQGVLADAGEVREKRTWSRMPSSRPLAPNAPVGPHSVVEMLRSTEYDGVESLSLLSVLPFSRAKSVCC